VGVERTKRGDKRNTTEGVQTNRRDLPRTGNGEREVRIPERKLKRRNRWGRKAKTRSREKELHGEKNGFLMGEKTDNITRGQGE